MSSTLYLHVLSCNVWLFYLFTSFFLFSMQIHIMFGVLIGATSFLEFFAINKYTVNITRTHFSSLSLQSIFDDIYTKSERNGSRDSCIFYLAFKIVLCRCLSGLSLRRPPPKFRWYSLAFLSFHKMVPHSEHLKPAFLVFSIFCVRLFSPGFYNPNLPFVPLLPLTFSIRIKHGGLRGVIYLFWYHSLN